MYSVPSKVGLHGILGRKGRVRGAVQIGRRQRCQKEEKHRSPGHSLGVSREPEPEEISSVPCLLLLQGNQIFHQLTAVPLRIHTQE